MTMTRTAIAMVLIACEQQPAESVSPAAASLVVTDPVVELEQLRDEVVTRLVERGTRAVDVDDLLLGALTGPELLGMTEAEHKAIARRLEAAASAAQRMHPTIAPMGRDALDSSARQAAAAIEDLREYRKAGHPPKGVECRRLAYGTCLMAAAAGAALAGPGLAPVVYGLAAHQCLCGYCSGGWVDRVCD